jgi:hypothetical protein
LWFVAFFTECVVTSSGNIMLAKETQQWSYKKRSKASSSSLAYMLRWSTSLLPAVVNVGACCWMLQLSLVRTHKDDNGRHDTIVLAVAWVICVSLAWMITCYRAFHTILEDTQTAAAAAAAAAGLPKTRKMTESSLQEDDHV